MKVQRRGFSKSIDNKGTEANAIRCKKWPDGRDLGENYTMTGWLMSPCVKAVNVYRSAYGNTKLTPQERENFKAAMRQLEHEL